VDPYWDVGGFDVIVNFRRSEEPYLMLEALSVNVDPDGWFAGFWPATPPIVYGKMMDNAAGTVHVFIAGLPGAGGAHTAPSGSGRIFSVTFREIYESDIFPPPSVEITLKNPRAFVHRMTLDSDSGLIDLEDPIGTQWTGISTDDFGIPISLDDWVDAGNGELDAGDDLNLTNTDTGKWHLYELQDIKGTLTLLQQPFSAIDDYLWAADFTDGGLADNGLPGRSIGGGGTDKAFNGYGNPYWTGNFSLSYPIRSVNTITAHFLPFTGDEYTQVLVEGVDYKVYPDEDLVELLTPLDVPIINEHWKDGVDNKLNGWPFINYFASGIQSVYRKFPAYNDFYGESEGFAGNKGFEAGPPSNASLPTAEWWYEPGWQWELEGWWALGYYKGPWVWPAGTEWWINYTAASYLTVDFNADYDPRPYSLEFDGTYEDFLALGDPIGTTWNEVYPNSLGVHTLITWADTDLSGGLSFGEHVLMEGAVGKREYVIDRMATDIIVDQVRSIDDVDLTSPFYGMEPIVAVAGFPHPDRAISPWHSSKSSVSIPHAVENGLYTAAYVPPVAREIDLAKRSAWDEINGMDDTFYAIVQNVGPAETFGKVVFTITTPVGIPVGIVETERILLLPGEIYGDKNAARYFVTWTAPAYGKYHVTAAAWYQDGQSYWHQSPDAPKSFSITIKP